MLVLNLHLVVLLDLVYDEVITLRNMVFLVIESSKEQADLRLFFICSVFDGLVRLIR